MRKYYSLGVYLPRHPLKNYRNFVNSKGETGNKKDPSDLEKDLPEDWELSGFVKYSDSFISIFYEFPKHPCGLLKEEILETTKSLLSLKAKSWSFDSV